MLQSNKKRGEGRTEFSETSKAFETDGVDLTDENAEVIFDEILFVSP